MSERSVRKAVPLVEDMKDIVENIISGYESRIQSIGAIFDTTHQIFEGFHDSFLDTKQEREKINTQIRDILAKNEHLRKKDFDNMMQNILSDQNEREKEVRNMLKGYLNEQKAMAQTLRENLERFKDALASGESQRVKEFQIFLKGILDQQEKGKEEVTSNLKEFQREQQEMAKRLKELLAKGRELRIRDLKLTLKEFKNQHKERIALRKERREEVCNLLDGFKKERTEAAQNFRTMQTKLAHGRTTLP